MKKTLTFLFILFLCSTWSFAQCRTLGTTLGDFCTLTEAGTITIPAGVTSIEVEAWGAGGGSNVGGTNRRSGGGGGAYFSLTYSVTASQTIDVTMVGQGAIGLAGTNTVFTDPSGGGVTVNGGGVGTSLGGAGGAAGAGAGHVAGGAGGNRSGATNGTGGGGGGSGPGATPGGNGTTVGGLAGMPGGGVGGNNGAPGSNGTAPGGGGSGQGTNGTAGGGAGSTAGANGQVIVTVIAAPLPVELVSFKANAKDNRIILEWQTASEENNEGFEIQKSKDGIAWDILDFVEGKGTVSVLNTYTSTDRLPTQGSNYYRLKQFDFDGKFEYSKTVFVDFNRLNEVVVVFPNPAKNQLTIIKGEGEATIYNVFGQALKQLTISDDQATIQLTDLLNGQYYLQVLQENGTIVTKQFVKVN
jgi:hypothetical protein